MTNNNRNCNSNKLLKVQLLLKEFVMLGHPLFFLCLASSDRPRFSRLKKKKKSYADGNEGYDTLFQTIFTLI